MENCQWDMLENSIVKKDTSNSEYAYIERELSEYLGTNVKLGNKKIEIKFSNMNDLSRILEIMNIKIN